MGSELDLKHRPYHLNVSSSLDSKNDEITPQNDTTLVAPTRKEEDPFALLSQKIAAQSKHACILELRKVRYRVLVDPVRLTESQRVLAYVQLFEEGRSKATEKTCADISTPCTVCWECGQNTCADHELQFRICPHNNNKITNRRPDIEAHPLVRCRDHPWLTRQCYNMALSSHDDLPLLATSEFLAQFRAQPLRLEDLCYTAEYASRTLS